MGSTEIYKLKYREAFAFIGKIGTENGFHIEKRGANVDSQASVTKILRIEEVNAEVEGSQNLLRENNKVDKSEIKPNVSEIRLKQP